MPSNTAAWLTAEKAHPFEVKNDPYTSPVLGTDVAAEVAEVGPGVTRFKPGDRVAGVGLGLRMGKPAYSAFQAYTVVPAVLASQVPSSLSYESASVLPLGVSTAACGLFQQDLLGLQLPTLPSRPANGETVLIWGSSSAVGSSAIQLAVAAGYEVIATASPKNFDYVRKLGATQVFDYYDEAIVANLIKAFEGKTSASALAIPGGGPPKELPDGVESKFIFGTSLKDNAVGPAIWGEFLPKALAIGSFVIAPEAEVVGKGLESVQSGLDVLKNGVSAKKIVITL